MKKPKNLAGPRRRRKARKKSSLALPWEQRRGTLGQLMGGSRLKAGLFLLGAAVLMFFLWRSADRRYRIKTTRATIATVHRAIEAFRGDIGRCPHSTTELVHPPRSGSRYLRHTPKDGWDREFHVQCPGHFDPDSADVISAGPSGSFQVDDNIQ